MSTEPDRDDVTDALLRKALQPPQTGTDGCVDAETLAAWTDGHLPADRAADVEAHVAGCARCQAVLGAFANADESAAPAASPASVMPFRPKSPIRWILPLAASVAATLVLWTAVRNREAPPAPDATMAKEESAPVPPTLAMDRPQRQTKAEIASTGSTVGAQERTSSEQSAAVHAKTIEAPKASAIPGQVAGQAGAIVTPPPAAAPPPPAVLAQPASAPAAAATNAAARRDVAMSRTDAEPIRADSVTWALAKVIAEFTPPAAATPNFGQAFAGGGRGGGGGRATAPAERATPNVRWRVLASGQVMKSTNDSEWTTVTITPTVFILNGHAPSPTVCWLVGRAGIVMLSTDGTKFTRVRFPDLSDLRSIAAVDAHQATITTTDGRVFTTFDAGDTWQVK